MTDPDRLINRILGDERTLTRDQVAADVGISLEEARTYWRAMGFADVGEAEAFTKWDVHALSTIHHLVSSGVLDKEEALEVVRSLGRNTARMAEWQTSTLARLLARQGDIPSDESMRTEHVLRVAELTTELLPTFEELLIYAWRRQLAAALQHTMNSSLEDVDEPGYLCVGFADIVGFTRLSRRLPGDRLADLVTIFESDSADVIAANGGRMIKTLGDEVMYVAESPEAAAEIAIELHEVHSGGQDVPSLRCGVAFGETITRMGDIYGSTVNRASRLTVLARPGATLVDDAIAENLLKDSRFHVRSLRPRRLRGLGLVRAWSLSRGR